MTPEQLNALQVEQQIASDNYNAMNDRMQSIRAMAQNYLNATPEQQARAKTAMQQLMKEYNTLGGQINEAFGRMNAANEKYNNALAMQQQPTAPGARQRRRTINPTNNYTIIERPYDFSNNPYQPNPFVESKNLKILPNGGVQFGNPEQPNPFVESKNLKILPNGGVQFGNPEQPTMPTGIDSYTGNISTIPQYTGNSVDWNAEKDRLIRSGNFFRPSLI